VAARPTSFPTREIRLIDPVPTAGIGTDGCRFHKPEAGESGASLYAREAQMMDLSNSSTLGRRPAGDRGEVPFAAPLNEIFSSISSKTRVIALACNPSKSVNLMRSVILNKGQTGSSTKGCEPTPRCLPIDQRFPERPPAPRFLCQFPLSVIVLLNKTKSREPVVSGGKVFQDERFPCSNADTNPYHCSL
jgi:hypothetical protein